MSEKLTVGWREWLALPELGIDRIKAKIDTGARTSALHAFYLDPFEKDDEPWIRFGIHPKQKETEEVNHCVARVVDRRNVTDSGGHTEQRYVIETKIRLGEREIVAELTLTDRENMRFRMLLGRTAMRNVCIVDSARSYLLRPVSDTTSGTPNS